MGTRTYGDGLMALLVAEKEVCQEVDEEDDQRHLGAQKPTSRILPR
jgi:hypothetical protein